MSDADFERGYFGHGRGVVVTQPVPGQFAERPMTAGELAARAPAWEIGKDPYEFLTHAAAAVYIRAWDVIAPAIDAALAAQAKAHDRRVTKLLEANNREVERRRVAEAAHEANYGDLWLLEQAIQAGDPKPELLRRIADICARARSTAAAGSPHGPLP